MATKGFVMRGRRYTLPCAVVVTDPGEVIVSMVVVACRSRAEVVDVLRRLMVSGRYGYHSFRVQPLVSVDTAIARIVSEVRAFERRSAD